MWWGRQGSVVLIVGQRSGPGLQGRHLGRGQSVGGLAETVQAHAGGRLEGRVGVEHVGGAGGRRGLRRGDGEGPGEGGVGGMGLGALEERRSGAVVLVTLGLVLLALRLGRAPHPQGVVVVVVAAVAAGVAVSLRVVVGPSCSSSTTSLLSVSLLPPWSVFVVWIVLQHSTV